MEQTLRFIGTGSCFNTMLGNNSAYYVYTTEDGKRNMLLIDCGNDVFKKIHYILDAIDELYIAITHTHDDHIGSLGSVIFYRHYVNKKPATLLIPFLNVEAIKGYLNYSGVSQEYYKSHISSVIGDEINDLGVERFMYSPVQHKEGIQSLSIILWMKSGKTIYFSGDTCDVPKSLKTAFALNAVDEVYIDMADYDSGVHLHINDPDVDEYLLPHKEKICIMHIPNFETAILAKKKGFDVAQNYNIYEDMD